MSHNTAMWRTACLLAIGCSKPAPPMLDEGTFRIDIASRSDGFVVSVVRGALTGPPIVLESWTTSKLDREIGTRVSRRVEKLSEPSQVIWCGSPDIEISQLHEVARGLRTGLQVTCLPDRANCRDVCP